MFICRLFSIIFLERKLWRLFANGAVAGRRAKRYDRTRHMSTLQRLAGSVWMLIIYSLMIAVEQLDNGWSRISYDDRFGRQEYVGDDHIYRSRDKDLAPMACQGNHRVSWQNINFKKNKIYPTRLTRRCPPQSVQDFKLYFGWREQQEKPQIGYDGEC